MSQSYDEGTHRVPRDNERAAVSGPRPPGRSDEPDVLLDVTEIRVDEISLEVEDLTARVSLQADVLELLKLHVGVDVALGGVQLTIKGVEAKVLLKVRLDNVARIIERVLDTIDNNPGIIGQLTDQVGQAALEVGAATGEATDDIGTDAGSAIEEGEEPGRAGEFGTGAGEVDGDLGQGIANAEDDLAEDVSRQPPAKGPRSRGRSGPRVTTPSPGGGRAKSPRRPRDHGSEEEG